MTSETETASPAWHAEAIPLLGTTIDAAVARIVGTSTASIRLLREKLNVRAFSCAIPASVQRAAEASFDLAARDRNDEHRKEWRVTGR